MVKHNARKFLYVFLVGGLVASVYGLLNHLASTGGGACNVNETFNCDIVNRGMYSEILGFPVAGIGIIGYLLMGVVAIMNRKTHDRTLDLVLLALAFGGFLFSLYLSYIEGFVLHTWCLICLASLSSIVGVLATSFMMYKEHPQGNL